MHRSGPHVLPPQRGTSIPSRRCSSALDTRGIFSSDVSAAQHVGRVRPGGRKLKTHPSIPCPGSTAVCNATGQPTHPTLTSIQGGGPAKPLSRHLVLDRSASQSNGSNATTALVPMGLDPEKAALIRQHLWGRAVLGILPQPDKRLTRELQARPCSSQDDIPRRRQDAAATTTPPSHWTDAPPLTGQVKEVHQGRNLTARQAV